MDNHPPCAATRKDGRPCTARALSDSPYCFAHAPEQAAVRAAARVKGGQGKGATARAGKLVPVLLRPTLDGLLAAFTEVKDGTLDPKVGTALATIAGAIVKVYGAGVAEERLADLERALAAAQEGRTA